MSSSNWWEKDPVAEKSKDNFWEQDEIVKPKKKDDEPGNLKNFGNAISSAIGQGIGGIEAGVGTFLQAPAANTLAAVKGAPAVADRAFSNALNSVFGSNVITNPELQEEAQHASQFAAESRDENVASKYNYPAKLSKWAQDDGRKLIKLNVDDDAANYPELPRQQQAISKADGFLGTVKALAQNPLGFTHTMVKALPDMAIGLGAGRVAAERILTSGAGAGEAAAVRIAAAGGDTIAQADAAQAAMAVVQQKATNAASTAGMLSEAGSSANSSRESSYNQVANTPFEKLEQSPRYREIKAQGNNPIQAREILANEVADQTPMLSGALTGAGTLMTNRLFGSDATAKVLAGVEKPSLKAVAKDALQEGTEEVLQGVPQGFSDHTAMLAADPDKKFDLGGEFVQNFAGGFAMGAGGHSGAYAFQKMNDAKNAVSTFRSKENDPQVRVESPMQEYQPVPSEAEAALMKPQNISALDRVGEIDTELGSAQQRLQTIAPDNGYGQTFDQERNELAQQVGELQKERGDITKSWPNAQPGTPTSFTTEAGVRLDAQYALMEAGDLQTSHDENLRANPAYPPELQPRERDRAASATQISGIVSKLDPARLGLSADAATGAPIVGADGLVESGNARTIALKRVYQANGQKAEDYKTFLTDNATQFGLDPAQIMGMQKPVLVRVRATPVNRAEFARQANASTVARMSSVEQARSDSARMDVMDDLNPDDNGDFTSSRDFIRRFMAKIPQTEVGEMIDGDGKLSPAGYGRMRNAILAKAYGDSPVLLRMTESLDDNMRNVSKALMQVAPQVAKIRASISEGHLHDADITPDLLGAVEELSRIKDKGKTVKEYLSQSGMFGDKLTTEGNEMLQFLEENIRRPRQMAEFILRYTEALEAMGHPGQADIFGENTAPTKGELLTAAKREQHATQEPVAGEGRNQAGEIPAGPDNSQRDNARGNEASHQGNDATAGRQADELIGEKINKDWTAFAPESGTLNIPRADMPQIKAEHRGAMVNFLKARDISSEQETVSADSLKPTQVEFAPDKVAKAKEYEGGDRSILVSSDNHVLDGHHQWLAKKELGEDVKVIRLDAPIGKLLDAVKEFPSAETSEGAALEPKQEEVKNNAELAPDISSIKGMSIGPGFIKTSPIANGKPLFRETSINGANDLLRSDSRISFGNVFVTDNVDIALGQGVNTGVLIKFRPDSLSGREHKKPMSGDLVGREYKTDIHAPRSIASIDFHSKQDIGKLDGLAKRTLKNEFTRTELANGTVQYKRKAEFAPQTIAIDSKSKPDPRTVTEPKLHKEKETNKDVAPLDNKEQTEESYAVEQKKDEYTQDMFGETLPNTKGGIDHSENKSATKTRDVDTTSSLPSGSRFASETQIVKEGYRTLGAKIVNTADDAAQAMAYLGLGVVERFDALVTDKNGKPLAIVGSHKGAIASSAVYPSTLLGEAFLVKNAAHIWFVHNHPSGSASLSSSDIVLNQKLDSLFNGSAIQTHGIMAIAGGVGDQKSWERSGKGFSDSGITHAPTESTKVFHVERQYTKDGKLGRAISSPDLAKSTAKSIANGESGLLLLDIKNTPIGFVPFEFNGNLRNTGRMDAIYSAVGTANAASAMLVDNHGASENDIRNVGALLMQSETRLLDVFSIHGDVVESWAMSGKSMNNDAFYSRKAQAETPDVQFKSGGRQNSFLFGMPVEDVTSHVDALAKTWANAPKINTVQSASDLPFAAPYDARGAFHQGKVWLVADNLHSESDVQMVLFHETLGHAGLRGALGNNLAPALRDIAARNQTVAKAAANWRKKNADIRGSRSEDKWHSISIEEALAEMTESGKQITGLQKFIAKVQTALRAVGLNAVASWMENATQAEVMALLSQARQHIQKGDSAHVFGHAEAAAFSTPETEEQKLSRDEARNIISTDVGKSFRELVNKSDDAFQFAKLKGDKDIQKTLDQTGLKFAVGNAKPGHEKVRSSATEQFVITNPAGEHAYVYRFGKDVQLDVSGLKSKQSRGTAVYQSVASWAHANGYIFEGDSTGISEAGIMRRTENMISSILRHGDSYHVKPHPDQAKALNIRWSTGDSDFNLGELLIASYNQIKGNLPEIDHVTPTEFGDFISKTGPSDKGALFAGDDFGRIKGDYARAELRRAGGEEAKTRPVGERTIKRAAITGALYAGATRRYESGLHVGLPGRGNRQTDSGIGSGVVYQALYSRAIDPAKTAAERAEEIIQTSAATMAPVDKLVKGATQLLKIDRATTALYNGAAFLLDRFTPETVKAGFVSDYGVPEAVIDRRAGLSGHMNVQTRKVGKLIDKLATLTREESRVAYEWMNNSSPQALKYFEDQLPKESVEVLAEVKKMIEALSKEAVALGQLSQDSYDKNSMEYLRRSYEKHTLLLDKGEAKHRARAISILGDQYKGRGLSESVPMSAIQNSAPEWWNRKLKEGKADKQLKGESFIRLERHAISGEGTLPLEGMEDRPKGKLQEVVYVPAAEQIPVKYKEWDQAGTYEVQDTKGGNVILWRDFTKQEREKMGEVDEARFAIAKTLHGMIHDVEVGRYMEWIGKKYSLAHATQVPGNLIEAKELSLGTVGNVYKPGDWVQIPATKVQGTEALKYGKLAGKYIPGPIWNDIRQINAGSFKPLGDVYASVLKAWKMSKTALSPAVHMNNVMANIVMADWHDVSAGHVAKSLRILMASSDREGTGLIGTANNIAARGGIADRDAAKEILGRYQDSGGNIGTFASAELQNEQIQPLLDALEAELATNPDSPTAQVGVMNALQMLRHGEMSAAFDAAKGSKPGKKLINEGKNLIDLYQSEDEVFRLAAWLKAKEDGATDMQAGHVSRKSFLDYNINAPWMAALRATAFPFSAFSYRAIPMLAETVAKRPWKVMKLAMLGGLLNALGYAMSGGDEDDERKYLPEEKAGRVWGLVPKLVRMPWNDDHDQPVFLDVRRFIPVGDIFDTGSANSAIPMLPALMPGGPMMLIGEVMLDASGFTGKKISLETDTTMEKLTKTADYLYKSMMPNLAILPGTHAWDSVMKAGTGGTDAFGRELSTGQAILNTVGVKVGSYGTDTLRLNAGKKLQSEMMEIDHTINGLKREYSRKGLTYEQFVEKAKYQQNKKKEIIEKFRGK